MPSLKSLLFGDGAFCYCSRAAFESDYSRRRLRNRLAWIGFHWTWWKSLWFIHWWESDRVYYAKWVLRKEIMIRLAKTGYSSHKRGRLWCIEVASSHYSWKWVMFIETTTRHSLTQELNASNSVLSLLLCVHFKYSSCSSVTNRWGSIDPTEWSDQSLQSKRALHWGVQCLE